MRSLYVMTALVAGGCAAIQTDPVVKKGVDSNYVRGYLKTNNKFDEVIITGHRPGDCDKIKFGEVEEEATFATGFIARSERKLVSGVVCSNLDRKLMVVIHDDAM